MRIIAGDGKGQRIAAPRGRDTRPTLDRVKESLFGIIQFEVPGSVVLDLFAGSGSLGIEALSRGARFAVFNDRSAECGKIIAENLKKFGYWDRAEVYRLDFRSALDRFAALNKRFDIAFLDPPYASNAAFDAALMLFEKGLMTESAVVVAEHAAKTPFERAPGIFKVKSTRNYGDCALSLLERDGEK